jgi:hypothetical protein
LLVAVLATLVLEGVVVPAALLVALGLVLATALAALALVLEAMGADAIEGTSPAEVASVASEAVTGGGLACCARRSPRGTASATPNEASPAKMAAPSHWRFDHRLRFAAVPETSSRKVGMSLIDDDAAGGVPEVVAATTTDGVALATISRSSSIG